jgi:hypothetical protein
MGLDGPSMPEQQGSPILVARMGLPHGRRLLRTPFGFRSREYSIQGIHRGRIGHFRPNLVQESCFLTVDM